MQYINYWKEIGKKTKLGKVYNIEKSIIIDIKKNTKFPIL